eukprot:5096789-Pyramimonas_sp.AAC.1
MWLSICGGAVTAMYDGTNTATPPVVPAPLSLTAAGARNPFQPALSIACCLSARRSWSTCVSCTARTEQVASTA